MASRNWDDTQPPSGQDVGQGDDRMRDDRENARERLVRGGHYMTSTAYVASGTDNDNEGKHVVGIGAGPHIYQSDKSTKLISFPNDTTVDMTNATSGVLGPNITSGNDPGHTHTGTVALRVTGAVVAGRIKVSFRAPRALTFVKASLVVFTSPATADLRVSAFKFTAPGAGINRGAGGTAVWLVNANKPTVPVGANFSGSTTTFDNVTTLAAGDEVVFEIDATGFTAAADLSIQLDVK